MWKRYKSLSTRGRRRLLQILCIHCKYVKIEELYWTLAGLWPRTCSVLGGRGGKTNARYESIKTRLNWPWARRGEALTTHLRLRPGWRDNTKLITSWGCSTNSLFFAIETQKLKYIFSYTLIQTKTPYLQNCTCIASSRPPPAAWVSRMIRIFPEYSWLTWTGKTVIIYTQRNYFRKLFWLISI